MKLTGNGMLKFGGVSVSLFVFPALIFVFLCDVSVYTAMVLLAVLTHESGHIIALNLCGTRPKSVRIYPFGVDMSADLSRLSYKSEMLVMLSGAAANIFLCAAVMPVAFRSGSDVLLFLILANAFFAVTNLIPIRSLDGGRALECALCIFLPLDSATALSRAVSAVSYAALFGMSVFIMYATDCNLSVTITLCYIAISAFLAEHLLSRKYPKTAENPLL